MVAAGAARTFEAVAAGSDGEPGVGSPGPNALALPPVPGSRHGAAAVRDRPRAVIAEIMPAVEPELGDLLRLRAEHAVTPMPIKAASIRLTRRAREARRFKGTSVPLTGADRTRGSGGA